MPPSALCSSQKATYMYYWAQRRFLEVFEAYGKGSSMMAIFAVSISGIRKYGR